MSKENRWIVERRDVHHYLPLEKFFLELWTEEIEGGEGLFQFRTIIKGEDGKEVVNVVGPGKFSLEKEALGKLKEVMVERQSNNPSPSK